MSMSPTPSSTSARADSSTGCSMRLRKRREFKCPPPGWGGLGGGGVRRKARSMKQRPAIGSTKRARDLRTNMTDAERAMWRLLREGFPDARFRRQVPIRSFIADFASHRVRLVIEVDGGQHSEEKDSARSRLIE